MTRPVLPASLPLMMTTWSSVLIRIDFARRHPTYEKIVRRSRTLHAHDERNEAGEGDVVRVVETRPLSKTKRWRLVDVVEKAR